MWYQFIKIMLLKHNEVVPLSNYYYIILDLFFVLKPPPLQVSNIYAWCENSFDYRTFYSYLFISFQTFYA